MLNNNFIRIRALRMIAIVSLIIGIPFMSSYINVYAETDPATITSNETTTVPTPTPTPVVTTAPQITSAPTNTTVDYTSGDALPSSVTGEKADGSATAVDYTYQGEKKFYTFKTKDGNTYYLIVDNEKTSDNVYFLTEINDSQLSVNGGNSYSANTNANTQTVTTPVPTQAPVETTKKDNSWLLYVVVILAGAVGLYFFKVKPMQDAKKKKGNKEEAIDPDLIEDEEEDNEEEDE